MYLTLPENCGASQPIPETPIVEAEVTTDSCQAQIIISTFVGNGLNQVHNFPSSNAQKTSPVKQGEPVMILDAQESSEGVWYKISYRNDLSDNQGWIHRDFLKLSGECLE